MKSYKKPEILIEYFCSRDIIASSIVVPVTTIDEIENTTGAVTTVKMWSDNY